MSVKTNYKILIFDLDDTLIDNRENVRTAFMKMLSAENREYSDDEFYKWYEIDRQFWHDWQDGRIELPKKFSEETGKKSDDFLDWLRSQRVLIYFDNKITLRRAIELNNLYMNALTETVVPIDGAFEILNYLHNKYKILIATNGPQIAIKQKLIKLGI
jgi:FMN phosphatase YigB (HAD superfamily)